MNSKRVAAVLACRVQSSRLYAKPLQRIGEKTILEHQLDQLESIKGINAFILAISDGLENEPFKEIARQRGHGYIVGDQIDVLGRLIQGGRHADAEIVVRSTTEDPFLYLDDFDELLTVHIREHYEMTRILHLPEGPGYELINLEALERSHREGSSRHRSELCSLYIWENQDKFRVRKVLPRAELRRPDIRLTVDYPEDLIVMRKIYEAFDGKMPIPIVEIIKFLDANPSIRTINADVDRGPRLWDH